MTRKASAKSVTTHYRPNPKGAEAKELTSEKIAAHIAAFCAAGGKVEKLGTTRVLGRVGEAAPAKSAPARK